MMIKTVLLDKFLHNRNRFDCGIDPLNNYLKNIANQQAQKDNTRTFVLQDPIENSHIIGFYTLTMVSLDAQGLPVGLQKKHRFSSAAGLIARLAVDFRYRGLGFGEWLLVDALKKLLYASDMAAFPLIVVDAKEGSGVFYEKYGFTPFHDAKNKLFITISDVRISFS